MHRRALLAGIGALTSGCLGVAPSRTQDEASGAAGASTPAGTGGNETGSSGEETPLGEYRVTGLDCSTDVNRPSARYVLEPSAFYSEDGVEREEERTDDEQVVREVSDIADDEIRAAIETAIRSGDWRSNTTPDGLAETVESVDFFTGVESGRESTHVGLTLYRFHPDRPPAVEFEATVVDDVVSEESPGVVEFELVNGSQRTQYVFSGTVPPFGMLFAKSVDSDDEFLLWRDYEEEGCIKFNDGGLIKCHIGKTTELSPGESITRSYEVLPSGTSHHPEYTEPPEPGPYRVTGSVDYYERPGAPESRLSYEVQFALERR